MDDPTGTPPAADATTADATTAGASRATGASRGGRVAVLALAVVVVVGVALSRTPAGSDAPTASGDVPATGTSSDARTGDDGAGGDVPPVGLAPAPLVDEEPGGTEPRVAVLAGGCFWSVQGIFQHVEGVLSAVSGYAGGDASTAVYSSVVTGTTDHAESVEVTYDPSRISYGQLLQLYVSVAHDPTQLDRQGPDVGPHYRSAIFPVDDEQARVAATYLEQLGEAGTFADPVVTRIEPDRTFYPAERLHQDFVVRNPDHPYVVVHSLPKLARLQRLFPDLYRATPALVLDDDPPQAAAATPTTSARAQ